jgi:hypothetical protein
MAHKEEPAADHDVGKRANELVTFSNVDVEHTTDAPLSPQGLSGSNSLAHLAARINAEHEACAAAMRRSYAHAVTAGELLAEAKSNIPHGQWLPWLTANCAVSPRTASLYMRLARNREAIEKSATVADLTIRAAIRFLDPKPTVADRLEDISAIFDDAADLLEAIPKLTSEFGEESVAIALARHFDLTWERIRTAMADLERIVDESDDLAVLRQIASDARPCEIISSLYARSERFAAVLFYPDERFAAAVPQWDEDEARADQ